MNLERLYKQINKINVKEETDEKIKKEILNEIQIEILTNGKVNKKIVSAYKRFVKSVGTRNFFEKIFKNIQGDYVLVNGFYLLDFGNDENNIPKELQTYIDNTQTDKDLSYNNLQNVGDLKKATIDVDKLEKIHKYNKIHLNDPFLYRIDNVYLNADYLLDMFVLAGCKNKKIECEYNGEHSPINIKLENCNMILLPIRVNEEQAIHQSKLEKIINEED